MFQRFPRRSVYVTAGVLALGVAFAAAPARASLEIELQSAGQTWSQTGSSPLSIAHSIGNFNTSVDLGVSGPGPSLDLSSANLNTSGAGTLTITLSENGLTAPIGPASWLTVLAGNFFSFRNVTVTLDSYLDSSNTLLGTGTALSTLSASHTPFDQSAVADATTAAPFAITEVLTVHATGRSVTALNGLVAEVPEPASLALLGVALFGIGIVQRRRGRSG